MQGKHESPAYLDPDLDVGPTYDKLWTIVNPNSDERPLLSGC
jgi:hypothetical protein